MESKEMITVLFKEIDVIQNIIKRMADNSFLIKGWTITLVVVSLLLKGHKNQVLIAFIPLLIFWILDAYFLRQERLFRKLYGWVIINRLQTEEFMLDMDTERFKQKVDTYFKTMFSITIGLFYGSLFILLVIYSLLLLIISRGGC